MVNPDTIDEYRQHVRDHTAGDTLSLDVTVFDEAGNRKDITTASVEWVLTRNRRTDAAALVHKTTSGDGVWIRDGANGEFTVQLEQSDTEDLAGGLYYHGARVTDQSGDSATVFRGEFEVESGLPGTS